MCGRGGCLHWRQVWNDLRHGVLRRHTTRYDLGVDHWHFQLTRGVHHALPHNRQSIDRRQQLKRRAHLDGREGFPRNLAHGSGVVLLDGGEDVCIRPKREVLHVDDEHARVLSFRPRVPSARTCLESKGL